MTNRYLLALLVTLVLAVCGTTSQLDTDTDRSTIAKEAGAPLFDSMGEHRHPVTTLSPLAQPCFDQGMVLAFGFNHAESIRSFRAAQTLDPLCAMCFWGEALATGPNINVTSEGKAIMSPEERAAAFSALQKARGLIRHATPDSGSDLSKSLTGKTILLNNVS